MLKKIKVNGKDAMVGAWLAEAVHDDHGELIAEGGTTVTEAVRQKLSGLAEVRLIIEVREDAAVEGEKEEEFELDDELKERAISGVKYIYSGVSSDEAVTTAAEIADMLCEAVSAGGVALNMKNLKAHDEYTFQHCVDVSVLGAFMARNMGLPKQTVKDTALAGLLHDIGKTKIPLEILNKNGRLTDEERQVMELHPLTGYKMIENNRNVSDAVKYGILTHHEKINGKGYNLKIGGWDIPLIGRILAVVDVFDALVTDRPYRAGMPSYKAVGIMRSGNEAGHFDVRLMHEFLSSLVLYPVGVCVLLNNGDICAVRGLTSGYPFSPCLSDVSTGKSYDLLRDSAMRDIHIESVIEPEKWA
ncbi:MAG: HD-GYP domain-containing protein [Lachnospiraceae bacterium]|nr:HD-GYP domain-containing protein [Lachnospiraceae bacterium]